jgi:hypothetical protein
MDQQVTVYLSNEQIQFLEEFCDKKGVKYYDVQIEIVDHLAHLIEEKLQADLDSNFESALENAYKSFGVTGFRKLIVEKENLASKHANKLFLSQLKSFFKLPHLLFTLILIGLFFILYHYLQFQIHWLSIILKIIAFATLVLEILIMISFLLKKKKAKKKLLQLNILPGYWFITLPSYTLYSFAFDYFFSSVPKEVSSTSQYIFICALIIYNLMASIAILQCYYKQYQFAKRTYPQAFK